MTDTEIERDADESWLMWRKGFMALGRDPAKFAEFEVWGDAYRAGLVTGQHDEQYQSLCLIADMAHREKNRQARRALYLAASVLSQRYQSDEI